MTEFTKQHIRNLRDMVEKSLDSNEVYVSEIALNEIQRLQARVNELEQELNGVVSDLTLQASGYDRRPQTPTVSEKSINFIPPESE